MMLTTWNYWNDRLRSSVLILRKEILKAIFKNILFIKTTVLLSWYNFWELLNYAHHQELSFVEILISQLKYSPHFQLYCTDYYCLITNRIHSLSIERHHCVGGISHQNYFAIEAVRGALDRHQCLRRDSFESLSNMFFPKKCRSIGEVLLEET